MKLFPKESMVITSLKAQKKGARITNRTETRLFEQQPTR